MKKMPVVNAGIFFLFIGLGCQKVVFNFGSVKLHKTELVLFRCPKIRKAVSALCNLTIAKL